MYTAQDKLRSVMIPFWIQDLETWNEVWTCSFEVTVVPDGMGRK